MTRRVVVGFDGSPAAVAARAWAAGKRGCAARSWSCGRSRVGRSRGAQPTLARRRDLVGRTRIPPVGTRCACGTALATPPPRWSRRARLRICWWSGHVVAVRWEGWCWVRSAGPAWRTHRARWSWSAHSPGRHHLAAGWWWVLTAPVIPAGHCASRPMRPGCVALSWLWCMPCIGTTAGRNCSPPPTSSSSSGAANLSPLNWPRPA